MPLGYSTPAMQTETYLDILQEKGLKKTPVRKELIRHFLTNKHALSFHDLQDLFGASMDKSTLYRNLSSFEEAGIIHRINDHSGTAKYAYGNTKKEGDHAHFVCEKCQTVYCLEGKVTLDVAVPNQFQVTQLETVIRGNCGRC